ncbi:hypothetical protein [uncultured Oceanisphaera sp.]|jgi:hypothetical protein|uniref:hypothetical protein n=1 Tax=uncultured Oceanisphaera sp. TaxID=353858 RepID=UPI0026266F0B|nr:hypothetical protein [uncultured Oceanisphaera sp.]
MRLTILLLATFLLFGCATHKSTLQNSEQYIFVTNDEEAIFNAAYDAMLDGRRETPIGDITGPIRGYSLTRKWALDYWTSMIRVFPAVGKNDDGVEVRGYYPEVSGEGTLIFRGPSMDSAIYESALERFEKVAEKTKVRGVKRAKYLLERDGWRLNSKGSLREGGTLKIEGIESSSNTEDRLQKIHKLKQQSVITEEEYQKLRASILSEI